MRTNSAVIAIAIAVSAVTPSAEACSCAERTLVEKFEAAAYVFKATVLSARIAGRSRVDVGQPDEREFFSGEPIEIEFDPSVDYKGRSVQLRQLTTVVSGASCGVEVVLGQTYIFFADDSGHVSLCGGSAVLPGGPAQWTLERQLRELKERSTGPADDSTAATR